MAELKIEKKGPDLFSFQLQWKENAKTRKQTLPFNKDGVSTRKLDTGTYALGWALTGDPGDEYSYKVTLSDDLVEEHEDKVPADRVVGGAILVEVA
jgi:hypothetical protein